MLLKKESEISALFHDLGSKESANLPLVDILGFIGSLGSSLSRKHAPYTRILRNKIPLSEARIVGLSRSSRRNTRPRYLSNSLESAQEAGRLCDSIARQGTASLELHAHFPSVDTYGHTLDSDSKELFASTTVPKDMDMDGW